jgi:two-component system nitrate/nitrite sensor histidine kinase NarX
MPDTAEIAAEFARFDTAWAELRPALERVVAGGALDLPRATVERSVDTVHRLVATIESDIARTTSLLRGVEFALVALAIAGSVTLIYLAFLFVVRPLHQVGRGLQRMARGELDVRVPIETRDEFGELARGFNDMAAHLQESHRTLEGRVAEKTRSLAEQNGRLATLYDMTAFLNAPNSLEGLCRGFLARLKVVTGADAGVVRLLARESGTLHLFVHEGMPVDFAQREHCLQRNECLCGDAAGKSIATVHLLDARRPPLALTLPHCVDAGFGVVATFPVTVKQQVLGVYNLFYRQARTMTTEERHMLATLGQHLGAAIETLRLASRDRELAIAEERNLLAQELHDSIAQSLAFLNLQTQMLRQAVSGCDQAETMRTLGEIEAGVRESYADVRELLVHFRTRVAEGDLEHGIRTLVARFMHQTGVHVDFEATGTAVSLAPDDQLQAMHILQEALSNVRKHAGATRVEVALERGPDYAITVRDNGRGFEAGALESAADHVGLKIMRERAARIGGRVGVRSRPGAGTEVVLHLPVAPRQPAAESLEAAA